MEEYSCDIKIIFNGNMNKAENKEDYIGKVKAQFLEEFGIELADSEIINVEVVK